MRRNELKHVPLAAMAILGVAGCIGFTGTAVYPDEERGDGAVPEITNTPLEIRSLARELEERAASRIQLGSMRLLVEEFEEVSSRRVRTGAAVHSRAAEDAAAVAETLRAELMLSLGNRVNVVDPDLVTPAGTEDGPEARRRASGATHALVGTWTRSGDAVDVTARLVHLDDGWIVATAQRRIHRFRALRTTAAPAAPLPAATIASAPGADPDGEAPAPLVGDAELPDPEAPEAEAAALPGELPPGIPEGAVIEFSEGPAAARLGRTKVDKPD